MRTVAINFKLGGLRRFYLNFVLRKFEKSRRFGKIFYFIEPERLRDSVDFRPAVDLSFSDACANQPAYASRSPRQGAGFHRVTLQSECNEWPEIQPPRAASASGRVP
jgi:hypothetical protein